MWYLIVSIPGLFDISYSSCAIWVVSTLSFIYTIYLFFDVENYKAMYGIFIIYKAMKYRKILIKYYACSKKAVFHSRENIKSCIFTVVEI